MSSFVTNKSETRLLARQLQTTRNGSSRSSKAGAVVGNGRGLLGLDNCSNK